jgi:hypothetical protein
MQSLERKLTHRDLARLFVKIFGLLILLGVAVDLPSTVYQFALQMKSWETAGVAYAWPTAVMVGASCFGPVIAYTAVGLSFMWWSGGIVDQAGQSPEQQDVPVAPTDLKNFELSLVTMIGLYFVASGLAELCRLIFSQGIQYGLSGPPTPMPFWTRVSWFEIPWIMQALMKLTIGALLVLGRGAAVATLHQARHWVRKWRAYPYQPD